MEYSCEKCHYSTKVKCNFGKHVASKRHSLDTQLPYICKCLICAKQYKSISGLFRHKKKKHKASIVQNSESLQISIKKEPDKKEPDKLVQNTIVKTNYHENDPSTQQKKKKRKKEKKPKTQKIYYTQSHRKTKRRKFSMSNL